MTGRERISSEYHMLVLGLHDNISVLEKTTDGLNIKYTKIDEYEKSLIEN